MVNAPDVKKINYFLQTDPGINSEMAVPIIDSADKVIGVVNAEALQVNAFNKEDEEFMEILADHVAIIVELFRLRQQKE